jgi:hypothetical protein
MAAEIRFTVAAETFLPSKRSLPTLRSTYVINTGVSSCGGKSTGLEAYLHQKVVPRVGMRTGTIPHLNQLFTTWCRDTWSVMYVMRDSVSNYAATTTTTTTTTTNNNNNTFLY